MKKDFILTGISVKLLATILTGLAAQFSASFKRNITRFAIYKHGKLKTDTTYLNTRFHSKIHDRKFALFPGSTQELSKRGRSA